MMIEAFSHQIFLSGWVCARIALLFRTLGEEIYQVVARIAKSFAPTQIHADPHPGNMLVRRRPCAEHRESRSHTLTDTQLVILDHGSSKLPSAALEVREAYELLDVQGCI